MRKIRHPAATEEARNVFTPTGRASVDGFAFRYIITPELAAVSPNLDNGPAGYFNPGKSNPREKLTLGQCRY
jgi:hypothetical protein